MRMTWRQALTSDEVCNMLVDTIGRAIWPTGSGGRTPAYAAEAAARDVMTVLVHITDLYDPPSGTLAADPELHIHPALLAALLDTGITTALRQASDHPYAAAIHALITAMPADEWGKIVDAVVRGVTTTPGVT